MTPQQTIRLRTWLVSQFQGSIDVDQVLLVIEEEGYTGVAIAAAEGEFEARSLLHEFMEEINSGRWYGEESQI